MLPQLDVGTMLVMTAGVSAAMGAALITVRTRQREGLGLWAVALLMQAVGYALYALRGSIPDVFSVVFANVLLSGAFALTLGAIAQFHGRRMPWLGMVLPVVALAFTFIVLVDHVRVRLVVGSLLMALQLALLPLALWCPRPPAQRRGAWVLTIAVAAQVVVLLARGVLVAVDRLQLAEMLHPDLWQSLVFTTASVVIVLAAFGFVLMTKERSESALTALASRDALTGVANRRHLLQTLERDLAASARQREPYAVLLLDLDHFKQINDTYGHQAGDRVLVHLVELLGRRLRRQALLGRYGGEEFLVLLPSTDMQGAVGLARALCDDVARTPCMHDGATIRYTISLGVCSGTPFAEDRWNAWIRAADRALYVAKEGGRNRVASQSPR